MPDADEQKHESEEPSRPARRRPLVRWLRRVLRGFVWSSAVLVVVLGVFVFTPAGDWWADRLAHVDPLAKADFIVLLGGNRSRAAEAARLYHWGWAPRIICTSKGDDANRLAEILVGLQVPREAILIDPNAMRTADHPRTILGMGGLDPKVSRVLVVTSLPHTSRSAAVFRKAGYRHLVVRAPAWEIPDDSRPHDGGWVNRAMVLPYWVYETLAWGMYAIRGWV